MRMHLPIRITLLAGMALLLLPSTSKAQPTLDFKRVVNNWPTIELYYSVSCGGVRQEIHDPSKFSITENGLPVTNFSQSCPDSNARCPLSVALVFDASGSMAGASNAGAKAGGHRFLDSLDGSTDQGAVLWFNTNVTTQQQMTSDKTLLHTAVDQIPNAGGTAVWDGIYVGVQEIIARGGNSCKAVVVLTDGGDNSSTGNLYEFLGLANRNHIRIFTIGLGAGIQSDILRNIAALSGGAYYETTDPQALAGIYADIAHRCLQGFQECFITYDASCMDGGFRPVALSVNNVCGGSDTKSKSYKAPKDTSTFRPLRLRLSSAVVQATKDTVVYVELLDPLANEYIGKVKWTLMFPESMATYLGVSAPPGSPLQGILITVTETGGGQRRLDFETTAGFLGNTGALPTPLVQIALRGGDIVTDDTLCTALGFGNGVFEAGCFTPRVEDGTLCVVPRLPHLACDNPELPLVTWNVMADAYLMAPARISTIVRNSGARSANGYRGTLEIDSVDFAFTGAYTRSMPGTPSFVSPADMAQAWWEGAPTPRAKGDSIPLCFVHTFENHDTVRCCARLWVPAAIPAIHASGTVQFCEGDSVRLSATPGFAAYRWSNGLTGASIVVRSSGNYTCTVTDMRGDTARTLPAMVVVTPLPRPVTAPAGSAALCGTATLQLRVVQPFRGYRWSTGETTEYITISTPGSYTVTVTDANGCSGTSDPVIVTRRSPPVAKLTGPAQACAGSVSTLHANAIPGARYRWSLRGADILLGDGTDAITVRWGAGATGAARVDVTDSAGPCSASDSITVSIQAAPQPRIAALGSTVFCQGDSVVLDAGAGYTAYSWSTGETTKRIVARAQRAYYSSVSDGKGCTGNTDTVFVQVQSLPSPSISGPVKVCVETEVSYTVRVGVGNTVTWTSSGGTIIRGGNDSTVFVRWHTAAPASIRVEITAANCTGSASLPITVGTSLSPAIAASGPLSFCDGGQVTLDAGAGYSTYRWSNGAQTQQITVTQRGDYRVSVENAAGCKGTSDTVRVNVHPLPPLPSVSRTGERLEAPRGMHSYQWRRDGLDLAGETRDTLRIARSGAYTVVVADTNGCTAESLPFVAIINEVEVLHPNALEIAVYPVPTSGHLQIHVRGASGDHVSYRVVDCLGRVLLRGMLHVTACTATGSVDLFHLADGVYLLCMESGGEATTHRVTKTRRSDH